MKKCVILYAVLLPMTLMSYADGGFERDCSALSDNESHLGFVGDCFVTHPESKQTVFENTADADLTGAAGDKDAEGLTELRDEISDLHRRYDALERKSLALQLQVAELYTQGLSTDSLHAADAELLSAYKALIESCRASVEAMEQAHAEMERVLAKGAPQTQEEILRYEYAAHNMRACAKKLEAFYHPRYGESLKQCHVLSVNAALDAVIISTGYKQGSRPGMDFVSGKNRSVKLRVVEIRPELSLCTVTEGDIQEIQSGMEVVPNTSQNSPGK